VRIWHAREWGGAPGAEKATGRPITLQNGDVARKKRVESNFNRRIKEKRWASSIDIGEKGPPNKPTELLTQLYVEFY